MDETKNDYCFNKKDQGKYESMFIPPIANELASYVFQFGHLNGYKYFSFADVPNAIYRYLNALQRHIDSIKQHYIENKNFEVYEKESGLPEIAFLLSNAMMIAHIYISKAAKEEYKTVREYIDEYIKPDMLMMFKRIKDKQN